jgi:GNAT superfamily N-acetyltransferase
LSAGTAASVPEGTLVRVATVDDVATIHALLVELAEATGLSHKLLTSKDDLVRHGFSKTPAFEVLLAEQDGTALGMSLYFYNYSSWRGRLGVYIQDLVVERHARGLGIGGLLVRETARRAKRRGATHLRLSVEHDNRAAHKFYDSLGVKSAVNERILEADGTAFERLAASP